MMASILRMKWYSLMACSLSRASCQFLLLTSSPGLRRRKTRPPSITLPVSLKRNYSAFYDRTANILVGLPDGWGTWRRPVAYGESSETIAVEPSSAISEAISIGTLSFYSLYRDSGSERSPLLSSYARAIFSPVLNEQEMVERSPVVTSAPDQLSGVSLLANAGTASSHMDHPTGWPNADAISPGGSQSLTVPDSWQIHAFKNKIQLMPEQLLPRRPSRQVAP